MRVRLAKERQCRASSVGSSRKKSRRSLGSILRVTTSASGSCSSDTRAERKVYRERRERDLNCSSRVSGSAVSDASLVGRRG
mgnify:CR=1 FL=1